jgi:integrase
MRVPRPQRSFLEPDMVVDLLDAAGEWERQVMARQRYGRRALLAALCLAGPRISELVLADRREMDLVGGAYLIPEAKTDAGERTVDVTAYLGDELRAHAAAKKLLPGGPMFPTRTGGRLNDHNIRQRLLPEECVRRANEKRAERGALPLPKKVTPHTLRRTFASLCFFAGRDARYVMSQLGHKDARLTLAVYAQCMERRRVDYELVWALMRFADEPEQRRAGPAFGPMAGRTADIDPPSPAGRMGR